jgi:tetratricopeptide (TPR) repeat protein
MSSVVKRRRPLLRLATLVILVLVGGAALLWAKARFFPELTAEASSAYSRRDWNRTASLALRRLKEAPDDPRALRLAARAAARQDQDQKTIAIYRRLDEKGLEAEDDFLLGRALFRGGQVDSAFGAYRSALEKDPDHPEALAALAALYARNDRYQAAEELARRLARQPASEAQARVMLGHFRAELHDPAGSARELQRWLEIDPEGRAVAPLPAEPVRMLLARSLLRAGRPAEARTILEALLGAGPDPEASWLLSRCFIQQGDGDRAAALLQQGPSYRSEHPIEPEPAPYVGEARCAECHRAQSKALLASRHARTFARARDLHDIPLPPDPISDPGDPRVTHRIRREGDDLLVETRTADRVLRAVVDYAFGSRDHLSTLVGKDDRGGSVLIRMSHYRSPRGTGWDLATGLPPRPDDEEEYLGQKILAGDGVRRCISCHTTNIYAILHEAGPEAADRSIGCERCHGPGGNHIAAVAVGSSDLAIVNPRGVPPAVADVICEKCHGAQKPAGFDFPRTDPAWLRFQSVTLTWSRCHAESDGALGCMTCHDPHHDAETSIARNEAKCLACHAPGPAAQPAGSSPSPAPGPATVPSRTPAASGGGGKPCPVNPARGCIDCHMPKIWVQGTHSFKTDHFIRVREAAPSETRGPAGH